MTSPARPPARRDEMTREWFDGLGQGRLLVRSCPDGHLSRPDVLACDVCKAADLGWQEASGRGMVVSLAVDHSTAPATRLAVVELREGPWLVTRIEGDPVERGGAVIVEILHPEAGEPYPVVVAG